MFGLIPLVYSSLILYRIFSEAEGELLLVQTLFRHGDRAPDIIYPTDTNKEDNWPEGLGKLTSVGKKQQYALGQFLRFRYENFITTNPNELMVNSSAVHRCLTSAALTAASFYAPKGRWKIQDDLDWQPIPIYYLPLLEDKFLSYRGTCPRVSAEMERQLNSEQVQGIFQTHQAKFEALSYYTGFNVSHGYNALYLYDALLIEKMKNLTIPEWVDRYWDVLEKASNAVFDRVTSSPLVSRLRAGPILQDMIQNIEKKISGVLPDLKVQMYSAHDVNIAAVLHALNLTNMPRPPYSAALLFELHQMADDSMTLRLLYLNSTDPLSDMGGPHILVLDECSEFCPVHNFTKNIEHFIPNDWEQECQMDN